MKINPKYDRFISSVFARDLTRMNECVKRASREYQLVYLSSAFIEF